MYKNSAENFQNKTVVALGTFDGIHLGHQRIIKDAISYARRRGLKCVVTTFDPHPQQFIDAKEHLKLLTTLGERKKLFKKLGVGIVKVFKFNKELRNLNCQEFVRKFIVNELKAGVVFVGYDYEFGKGRSGGVKELRIFGEKYDFKVKMVRPFKSEGIVVKSSFIRRLLAMGDFRKALSLLGHYYNVSGQVIRGAGRGSEIGFPTANLFVDRHKLIPVHGVYVGVIGKRRCLVNIGVRPTFKTEQAAVEVFIPKFHGNLYGKKLEVKILKRLRNEIKFPNSELLKEQIKKDIDACLSYKLQ